MLGAIVAVILACESSHLAMFAAEIDTSGHAWACTYGDADEKDMGSIESMRHACVGGFFFSLSWSLCILIRLRMCAC